MSAPKVLIACEESQRVCIAMREVGCEAYSCDIIQCSGGHPEWHIQGDVLKLLNGSCYFLTSDWNYHTISGSWDMIIAQPPCTDLAVSGARWFSEKQKDLRQQKACVFFMQMILANCKRIAVENPIGIMSSVYRKPDQIIQPYEYGHPTRKSTCLWLENLPPLKATNIVKPEIVEYQCKNGKVARFGKGIGQAVDDDGKKYAFDDPMTAKLRSRTFEGIGKAMAEQWGKPLVEKMKHQEYDKKILDMTCGSRTIWFDKDEPHTIYCDKRIANYTGTFGSSKKSQRTCIINQDVVCDFTQLPFPDDTFSLVVFDPPHLEGISEKSWLAKKYGVLGESWRDMLREGFKEGMRVLKPDGIMIFKWAETHIPANEVWKAIGQKPLFGHHSGKKSQTFWCCFMKFQENIERREE